MALACDEVGAFRNNTGCNKARMIRHIYHDSPLLAHGGAWRKSTASNQGSYARQCFDSGRAARSGRSHYLHISSVKLIVFTASLHEPTCHSNLVCGRHSSVPAKCGKSGHLRQARMLLDKETSWLGGGLGRLKNNPMWFLCSVSQEPKASSWCEIHFRSLQRNNSMKTTSFNESASATEISMLILLSSAMLSQPTNRPLVHFYLFQRELAAVASWFHHNSKQVTRH